MGRSQQQKGRAGELELSRLQEINPAMMGLRSQSRIDNRHAPPDPAAARRFLRDAAFLPGRNLL